MNAVPQTIQATPSTNTAMTPMEMLSSAIDKGAAVEMIDKLMTLQERWEANQGRKAFDDAIAQVKADERFGAVSRNRTGHNNKRYADFEAYAKMLDPILADNGLSYRFESDQENGQIKVTCVVAHRDGHSTRNTLQADADKSGNKNSIQAVGSTLTYLQRYTLVQAFGLAASDDDDGNASGQAAAISDKQFKELQTLIDQTGVPTNEVCEYLKIGSLKDMPVTSYALAVAVIKRRASEAS